MFTAFCLVIGLLVGIWLKRWWIVLALIVLGTAVAGIGWSAKWWVDDDTTASGGALLFELSITLPAAIGVGVGVGLTRWRGAATYPASSLPIVPPPDERSSRAPGTRGGS